MRCDADVGMECISGIHTALGQEVNAWQTFGAEAARLHSHFASSAYFGTSIPVGMCPSVAIPVCS